MASDAMDVDGGDGGEYSSQKKSTAAPAPSTSSSPPTQATPPVAAAATSGAAEVKRYKYKYPEAYPTPPGEDDETWNKLFTAADSRLYNRHGKSSTESKKYRNSGETYQLALRMLQERRDKAAGLATSGSAVSSSKPSTPKPAAKKASSTTSIKKEPSTSSRDATPAIDRMSSMSISEKIKSEGRPRKAPSVAPSDHEASGVSTASVTMSSPAPPPLPAPKVEKPKKKGTAAPVKKRGPKHKSEDNANISSSSRRASMTPATKNGPSSEEDSNDGGEYCICRGPDDHRMMVYCDGGCDDWYHCSCLNIDVADAKELLDRFICPTCETETLFTTWKRMCRYWNVGKFLNDPNACRKAARVSDVPPSKYCSDEHREAFWEFVKTNLARQDNEPSRGGRLNVGEVGWILSQVKTVEELHALGSKPKLPAKEGADPDRPPGLDFLTEEEEQELQKITDRQMKIEVELTGYRNQEKLRTMIIARAEKAAAHLEVKIKEICGYDNRLVMNQYEFAKWSTTEEGKLALETGILGPRTAETKSIGAHVLLPGQAAPDVSAVPELNNICLKKKCAKHSGWAAIHKDEFSFAYNLLIQEKKKLSQKKDEIISEAETTEAMRPEYSDNVTVQLF